MKLKVAAAILLSITKFSSAEEKSRYLKVPWDKNDKKKEVGESKYDPNSFPVSISSDNIMTAYTILNM